MAPLNLEATTQEKFMAYCKIINRAPTTDELKMTNANLQSLFPGIKGPIVVDYGTKLTIGASSFINRHCFIGDNPVCEVSIGERTLVGPYLQIHSVFHPVHWADRNGAKGPSVCGPVSLGNDVFVGGGAIILPGVTIDNGAVVGAGSVVTKDVPAEHILAGNPARVIKKVPDKMTEVDFHELGTLANKAEDLCVATKRA